MPKEPDWTRLRELLDDVEQHLDAAPDHDPEQGVDEYGAPYCYGCELGVKTQALHIALDDYLENA